MSLGAAQAREKEAEIRRLQRRRQKAKEEAYFNNLYKDCVARQKRLFTKALFADVKEDDTDWKANGNAVGDIKSGWARDKRLRLMPGTTEHQLSKYSTGYNFPKLRMGGGVVNDGLTLKDGTMLAKASSKIKLTRATKVGPLRSFMVTEVSSSMLHTLVATQKGDVLSFGVGRSGQLGNDSTDSIEGPELIKWFKKVRVLHVAAGGGHSLVLGRNMKTFNVDLYAFGENKYGQLGLGPKKSLEQYNKPQFVQNVWVDHTGTRSNVAHIRAGTHHSMVHLENGKLFTWGNNLSGQLGHGNHWKKVDVPKQVLPLKHEIVEESACGDLHTVVITDAGDIWSWGRGLEGQLGHAEKVKDEDKPVPMTHPDLADLRFKLVACGRYHTVVTTEDGIVYTFGSNKGGQLSTKEVGPEGRCVPRRVQWDESLRDRGEIRAAELSAGAYHTLLKDAHGNVYSCGWSGFNGRLGFTTSEKIDTFKEVSVYRTDAHNEDLCWQREFLDRMIDIDKVKTTIEADYIFPIDCMHMENGNFVSEEVMKEVKDNFQRIHTGNFLCKLQRVFRGMDISETGHMSERDVWRALLRMHISTWNLGVRKQLLVMGGDGIGSCDEWDFVNFLVEKFEAGKIRKAYFSPPYRLFKWIIDEYDQLEPHKAVQSMHVKTFIRIFLSHCEEMSIMVDPETVRLMFEYEVNPREERERLKKLEMISRAKMREGPGIETVERPDTAGSDSLRPPSRELHHLLMEEGRPGSAQIKKRLEGVFDETTSSRPSTPMQQLNKSIEMQQKKVKELKFRRPEQPLLRKGTVDWSNLGLTDGHIKALALSLKELPIFAEVDLRGNIISDEGLKELLGVVEWQYMLSEYDMYTTRCIQCKEDVFFDSKSRHTAFCIRCNRASWRPAYMLAKIEAEDLLSPTQRFKWTQSEFDKDASQKIADFLNSRSSAFSVAEFKDMYAGIVEDHIEVFCEQAETYYSTIKRPKVCTRKYRKLIENHRKKVDGMVEDLRHFSEEMYLSKHLPRYRMTALVEQQKASNKIREWLIREAFDFFHANVPLHDEVLLRRIQDLHIDAVSQIHEVKWEFHKMTAVTVKILYAIAKDLYEHYAQLNKMTKVESISCGYSDSLTISQSGVVYSFGNNSGIIEAFKEQIVYNLPDRFRASIEKDRAKARLLEEKKSGQINLYGAPQWASRDEAESVSSYSDGEDSMSESIYSSGSGSSYSSYSVGPDGVAMDKPERDAANGDDSPKKVSPYKVIKAFSSGLPSKGKGDTKALAMWKKVQDEVINAHSAVMSMRNDLKDWQREVKESIEQSKGENSLIAVNERLARKKILDKERLARKNAQVHTEIEKLRERDRRRQEAKMAVKRKLEREAQREEEIRIRMAGENYVAEEDRGKNENVDRYHVDAEEAKYGRVEDLQKLFTMLGDAMVLGIWEALEQDYTRTKVALLHLLEAKIEQDAEDSKRKRMF
eukprot:g6835.t1